MTERGLTQRERLRAWKLLGSATIGYGAGSSVFIMTAGLFVIPMQREFGWSATALTIGPIVHLTMSLCNPFAGMIVDRLGARRVAIAGLLLLAGALAGLSLTPPDKLTLYSLVILVGIVAPLSSSASFMKGVATWFTRGAGAAFGIAASGSSLVALVAMPVVSAVIYQFGWRFGYLALVGFIFFVALPPVLLWFRERGEAAGRTEFAGREDGQTLKSAVCQPRYWLLLMVVVVASIPVGGFLMNLVPLLIGQGLSMAAATSLGVAFALAISLGRVGGGMLIDRYPARLVVSAMLLAASVGSVLLGMSSGATAFIYIAAAVGLIGMAHGVEADLIAYFTLQLFGLRAYSTIYTTVAMGCGLAMAAGGTGFALSRDLTGSFLLAMQIGAGCYAIAGLMILFLFAGRANKDGCVVTHHAGDAPA